MAGAILRSQGVGRRCRDQEDEHGCAQHGRHADKLEDKAPAVAHQEEAAQAGTTHHEAQLQRQFVWSLSSPAQYM